MRKILLLLSQLKEFVQVEPLEDLTLFKDMGWNENLGMPENGLLYEDWRTERPPLWAHSLRHPEDLRESFVKT